MISNAVVLFFVLDPFGLIPVFMAVMARVPQERHRAVLVRELLIGLVVLVVFLFAGRSVLDVLHISEPALAIAGAVILFLIALTMIFPSIKLSMDGPTATEPFIVPLATPMFAGPSAITLVMLMSNSGDAQSSWPIWLATIFAAWLPAAIVLLLGQAIASRIGSRGVVAIERLMGMFLVAMAIEMLLSGISQYFGTLRP